VDKAIRNLVVQRATRMMSPSVVSREWHGEVRMEDSLSTIAALTKNGYRLKLYRNAYGLCWADLRRGWILRKHVRVDLDRDRFEEAKQFLGTHMTRTRVRLPLGTHR